MTYEEFKKSALNKQDENDSYLDFKNRVLNNTDPLKTLMNATSTYSMGSDGKLVKTPNMEESMSNSKKKTALELLQETQNIGAGDTTYIPPDAIEKYTLKDVEEKEAKIAEKYDAITPVANYIAGDLATDLNEAYAEYSNNPTELNKKKVERAEKLYNDYIANAKNVGKGGWITKDFANYLPQGVEQLKAGLTGGVIAGGATSAVGSVVPAVGNVIGFAGGFKAGYTGGVAKYSYDQMQGAMYKALIDLGREYNADITHDVALEISKDTALLQAFVEAGETILDFAGIGKLFKKGGAKTVKAMTRKQIIAKALKAYGINLVTETLEEGTQEKIAIEGEKKALSQAGINNPYTKEQEAERIKEAGYGGFKISAIAGLGNVGGSVIVSAINNNNINEINKAYDTAISEINANEKLTTEQKQEQIATLTNERIQVLQKVKGEIDKNEEKGKELYYMAGPYSKTANKTNLNLAETLEKAGKKTQEIYEKAGWFRNSAGQWTYEIDDSKAKLTLKDDVTSKKQYVLSEIYDHPELYEAYPELKDLKIVFSSTLHENNKGNYNPQTNTITISNIEYHARKELENSLNKLDTKSAELLFTPDEIENRRKDLLARLSNFSDEKLQKEVKSRLAHEIQHWVQEKEGFPQGTSPRVMKSVAQNKALQKLSNYTQKLIDENAGNEQLQSYLKDSLEYAKQTVKPKKNLEGYQVIPVDNFSRHLQYMLSKNQHSRLKKLTKEYIEADGYEMYRNTAGEQQARDVQKRMDMTPEERQKTMPFVKDKNTVFAEEVDIKEKEEYDNKKTYIDTEKGIYIDASQNIWYEKSGIDKKEVHYGEKLYQAIDDDTPKLRKNKIYGKEFGDYLFVFRKKGHNDYSVISQIKIEGNEDFIKVIKGGIKNGTFGSTETIVELIKIFNNRNRSDINNNDSSKRREKNRNVVEENRGTTQQSRTNDRKNLRRINENSDNLKNSEKGSNFLPEERYDAMPMTAQEKLEKWADDRQDVYRNLAKEFGMGANYWEANMDDYTQEQATNFVSREWNVVKKFAEQNNIEIENTYNFEKRIRESNEFQEYVKNFVAPLYNEKPKLTSEELTELAQDTFGTTDDFTFGAYMTTDGKLLDFEYGGYRDDHRGIHSINYKMHEFMNAGNIRMQPEGNGFEIAVEPTEEQYERLAEYIDNYLQGDIFVDITNERGNPIAGRSYAENTPSSKIFNDIKEYFRTGKYPEKSELDDFRYDMMPTMKDGFYSQLENVIINKMQKQAKASDIMNLIQKNGVKQDEIAWTGVDDFLASRDIVTKEELLQYIRASQLEVDEAIKVDGVEDAQAQIEEDLAIYESDLEYIQQKIRRIFGKYNIPYKIDIHYNTVEPVGEFANILDAFDEGLTYDEDGDIVGADGEPVGSETFADDRRNLKRYVLDSEGLLDLIYQIENGEYEPDGIVEATTKYENWKTNFLGHSNYREVLYVAPQSTYTKALSTYKSPHWDEDNVIAHTRLQDYEDDGGAKVLFIEEIQSDMHQEGRKYGYKEEYGDIDDEINRLADEAQHLEDVLLKESNRKKRLIENKYNATGKELAEILNKHYISREELRFEIIRPLEKKTDPSQSSAYSSPVVIDMKYLNDDDIQLTRESMGLSQEELEKIVLLNNELTKMLLESKEISFEKERIKENSEELQKLYTDIEALQLKKRNNHKKIDSKFPFKKNWHEFVIRKAINEAVQQGYDKVAWTTGKQQNDRYNLAKYIDEIQYEQKEEGRFSVYVRKDGRQLESFHYQTPNDLENLLGKGIAEKIINKEGKVEELDFEGKHYEMYTLSGLDLEVGGEGMKGFYDKIVPDYVNKYIKKWNSKVEEVRIPDYGGEVQVQQGFTITPEMRKSVQEIGQPLYDKEPSVDTMSRKNIIDKFRTVFGIENFSNTNKELNSIASNIRNKIKSQKITTTDIKNIVEELGERLQVTTDKYNGEFDDLKDELRSTKIYVSENAKKGFAHWNDFRKNNFGTLRLTNDTKSIKISELYEDLQQRYGTDMFPDNIINESDQLEQIAEIAQNLKKENISIEEYSRKMYGPKGWQEIQQMMVDEIKAIRDEYDLENPIDTSKRARVADKRTRDILHALNISDEEIYDPANAFVQNILESMEKDTEYFSRTLKEIEEENLMFGNKRVNTILNKRRYDVQSGRVKANPKYTEGASLSSIRKTIESHTGKKIGLNGFRQRAYGIYKPTLDTIRIKNISNVETAIHELGHRINYVELNQSLKGASRAELNKLAERAFGPMYDDKPDVKLEEGWAEFTKRFICDNEATVKEYPQLSTYMVEQLEGNRNMKAVVEKLIELSEQYVNAPTAKQIRKMQSVGQDTDSSDKRTFFGQYMYEVHDDLYDIKRMMKTFAKAMKVKYWDITPELNIYNLMRLARSNEDRVLNVMQYGLIDDKGNRRTEGLGELSELLGNDPEQIQKVRDLLIAMRTLDYTAVGLDTGLSTAEAMKLIEEYSKDKTIMRVANGIITFQDEVMKYAVEKGLMTQEQYEEMKKWNRFYIPLKRVFEGKVNSSSAGTGASKLTKRRTGSMRDIIDPFEAIIQNTSMILDKINQNEIMRALALLQEKTGIADFYEKIAPPQKLQAEVELNLFKNYLEEQGIDTDEIDLDVVQKIFAPMMNDESKMIMGYMEKGKLQAIEFKDRFIYEAISQSAGSADLGVILERALSVSQLLRLGATSGNIEFAIPNMISDTMTAWMFSESGFVPLVDTFRGLVDYSLANYGWADNLTKDSKYKQQNKFLYDLYKQSGATMATRVGSYRPEVQEYVLEIFGKHANDLLSDDVNVQKEAGKEIMKKLSRLLGKTQDVLSILPELSEQATRFEHFKKDYLYARNQGHNHKNALLKATINTRDITMDFNRMGHTMRVYNRIRAFSGARAQGIYRFIEAVNKMPKKVLGKLGILAGLAIALKAGAGASGNKKEEEITDQVRKDNFIIPLGKDGEVVTIKKPQGTARSIINFAELLYDVGFGNVDEKDYNKVWLNWLKDTIEENAPLELDLREGNDFFSTVANMALPTALEPIIENALNKDFYYGNPIIPYGKEGLRAEDQYDENTSQTAILLGKVLGQSPAKIENLITGWTAGVGQQVLDASDAILGKVSKDIPDQPSRELNSKTVLRRFFANSFKNSDSVSEVYEQIEKIEQLKEYEEASETELETLEKLNSAKKTMSDLNKQIKGVRNSLTLTSDQKRDQIKDLQILRTDVARNALGKELINPASKEQVELYEYYPSKTTFKYEVHANKTVEVEYTEDDVREYARIVKDTYETALAKEQKKRTYKEMTPEEQKKKRNSLLTSAKSSAQEKVSREIYRRSR